jgi:hypothetical protein
MTQRIRERSRILRRWRDVLAASGVPSARTPPSPRALFLITFVAAVFLALAGAFGTWDEPVRERLGFWLLGVGGSGLVGFGLDRLLIRAAWLRDRPALRAIAILVLITPPAGLVASTAAAALVRSPINWSLYWQTLPQMLLVGLGLVAIFLLVTRKRPRADAVQDPMDPSLGGLLPLKFRGAQLFALEAQDHHVRIHTDRGNAPVLMSPDRALANGAHLGGKRVHRSWWVARAAVTGVQRGDGRATLALPGGVYAPVSRRYARDLRSSGWY